MRARPVDSSQESYRPRSSYPRDGAFWGWKSPWRRGACPCCGATDVNACYARLHRRPGAQVNQHQSLLKSTRCPTPLRGCPSDIKRKAERPSKQTGISSWTMLSREAIYPVITRPGATSSEYRNKAVLLDVMFADPQAGGRMRAGSADQDGSAAYTSEAQKRSHYACSCGTGVLQRALP